MACVRERVRDKKRYWQRKRKREREAHAALLGEQVERERVLLGYARGDIDEVLVCVGV